MSKMGQAAQWVQENGLTNDPKALSKYIQWERKQTLKAEPKHVDKK
jgi:hypothetical protein